MYKIEKPKFKEIILGSFDNFIEEVVRKSPCSHFVYRGCASSEFRLVPSLGRLEAYQDANVDEREELEKDLISRSYSSQIPNNPEFSNDFLSAVTAQHHGAPTRLLDWTLSPLIAAYFATKPFVKADGNLRISEQDAAIFGAHICPAGEEIDSKSLEFPFHYEQIGTYLIEPPISTPRVAAQQSVFTISCDPTKPMEEQDSILVTHVIKYVIPLQQIPDFQRNLFRLGIRERGIFPGPDGVNASLIQDMVLTSELGGLCNVK